MNETGELNASEIYAGALPGCMWIPAGTYGHSITASTINNVWPTANLTTVWNYITQAYEEISVDDSSSLISHGVTVGEDIRDAISNIVERCKMSVDYHIAIINIPDNLLSVCMSMTRSLDPALAEMVYSTSRSDRQSIYHIEFYDDSTLEIYTGGIDGLSGDKDEIWTYCIGVCDGEATADLERIDKNPVFSIGSNTKQEHEQGSELDDFLESFTVIPN